MGPLAAVERFLERLFERQTARIFKTSIRPIQVQRRVERAMESGRLRNGGRTHVPHRFIVRLSPADMTAIRASDPNLAADLADAALAFARSHGYTLAGRPVVSLAVQPSLAPGDVAIEADAIQSADDFAPPIDDASDGLRGAGPSVSDASAAGRDGTAVFVLPTNDGPRATLREIRPDRTTRTIEFDGRPLTIGRGAENEIVLRDARASRHHARIDSRRGSLVLTDVGSTNGSFVNDRRVDSVALGEGDRIRLGTTVLVVEVVASGDEPEESHDQTPG
jgi:hypothetical protein